MAKENILIKILIKFVAAKYKISDLSWLFTLINEQLNTATFHAWLTEGNDTNNRQFA